MANHYDGSQFSNLSLEKNEPLMMKAYVAIAPINRTSENETHLKTGTNMVLCSCGAVINLVLLVLILSKRVRNTAVSFLATVAVLELITMLTYILTTAISIPHAPCFSYFVAYILSCYDYFSVTIYGASVWTTVTFMIFRAYSVTRKTPQAFPRRDAVVYFTCVGIILPACILINLPALFLSVPQSGLCWYGNLRFDDKVNEVTIAYKLKASNLLITVPWLLKLSYCINGVIFKLIPCILLLIEVTILVLKVLESHNSKKKLLSRPRRHSLPRLAVGGLLVTLVVFLSTQLPNAILNIKCVITDFDSNQICSRTGAIQDMLSLINSIILFPSICISNGDIRGHIAKRSRALVKNWCHRPIEPETHLDCGRIPSFKTTKRSVSSMAAFPYYSTVPQTGHFDVKGVCYIDEDEQLSILADNEARL